MNPGEWLYKAKHLIFGKSKSPLDHTVYQHISLVAFFAWVGLGADGLSSSCYGPEEAFLALKAYPHLSIFVAIASALTVLIISAAYSQIIELFPTGGGGYLVASKLLSPGAGLVSGCALLIDYILTITISIAAGADAVFSFLPAHLYPFKLAFSIFGILLLTLMNIRGIKESVMPLVPVFLVFILTHAAAILYVVFSHVSSVSIVVSDTAREIHGSFSQLGFWGLIFLLLRAYSMGAGTFTGIEAVSNGLPILRDPKIETGKKTMRYMSFSLVFMVVGLAISYIFLGLAHQPGKTLNAVMFGILTQKWGHAGEIFTWIALFSEGLLLFVAAQAGFLDGPRVLASMALDRWFPARFSLLSDRLVTHNGVLLMSGTALITLIMTKGSVQLLVVLYSINVFITFCLSQLGMVRYWWTFPNKTFSYYRKFLINLLGLLLTSFILISVIMLKFTQGGWITLVITAVLILAALGIRHHYRATAKYLERLNRLVHAVEIDQDKNSIQTEFDAAAKTAVLLVNGFNGIGLHTLFGIIRHFGRDFKNFIFVEIGIVDAGNFKGKSEVANLEERVKTDIARYVQYMKSQGFYAEGMYALGIDVIYETEKLLPLIMERFQNCVFFGGQIVFPKESFLTRWLHNYTVFAIQKKLYRRGIPFVIFPIRIDA